MDEEIKIKVQFTEEDMRGLKQHLGTLGSFNQDMYEILANCSAARVDGACAITVSYDEKAPIGMRHKIRMNCDPELGDGKKFYQRISGSIHERAQEKINK